jgi:aminopeptidase N
MEEQMLSAEVMSHEMAHMWFGDWVSPASWGEIWRNEGFATYFSQVWMVKDDPEDLQAVMDAYQEAVQSNPASYPLNNPPPGEMFGMNSYLKGALLVHDLRKTLGDEDFYAGLRLYFERYGGGSASDAQFQEVMEEVSGQDLDAFFAHWFSS